jgi:hypothetical protein
MSENEDVEVELIGDGAALEDALTKAMKRLDEAKETEEDAPVEELPLTDETEARDENVPMEWPLPVYPLVAKFDVQPVDLEDQAAIVIALYTGAGASFGLITREGALALASRLKKTANSLSFVDKKEK